MILKNVLHRPLVVRSLLFPGVLAGLLGSLLVGNPASHATDRPFIIVQSTTSTQNSGLYDAILPNFTEATGVEARVVAVGTGQAIRNAGNCDGDVLLVHARQAEEQFVEQGFGVERFDVMYNDFVIIGPERDPAGVAGMTDVQAALEKIQSGGSAFASRGDDSGTHKAELRLWAAAGIDPTVHSGGWYRETGSGMGATLNVAIGMGAYVMSDRASWISHANKGTARVLVQGDAALFNQYGVIRVDPDHCPNVKADAGQRFVDWILSDTGQAAVAAYTVDGQQLFFPNASH